MAGNKFRFHILTGSDPLAQYNAISPKDPYTFYLTDTGIGYLGTVPLFGGVANRFVFLSTAGTYNTYEEGKMYLITIPNAVHINGDAVNYADVGMYIASSTSTLTSFDDVMFLRNMVHYIADNTIHSDDTNLDKDFVGTDTELMTSRAVTTFVSEVLDDISLLKSSFFRTVQPYTLTQADIVAGVIHINVGDQAGDVGLLFTRDNDMTDDGNTDTDEEKFFINLTGYITIYTGVDTNSIDITIDPATFEISCSLKIKSGENSIYVDNGGVALLKTSTINETTPSSDKLVTEASLVAYITAALEDVVRYTISDGSGSSGT